MESKSEMQGEYLYSLNDPENAEYVVQVDWIKIVPDSTIFNGSFKSFKEWES